MSDPLASPEALADLIGDDVDPTDAQLPRAIALVSALIRAETGQEFSPQSEEVTLEGTDRSVLLLPRAPVLSVEEVSTKYLAEDFAVLDPTSYEADAIGRLRRMDDTSWGGSNTLVRVIYSFGFEEPPEWIQALAISAAKRLVVYADRYSDQQVKDGSAGITPALTRSELRALSKARRSGWV